MSKKDEFIGSPLDFMPFSEAKNIFYKEEILSEEIFARLENIEGFLGRLSEEMGIYRRRRPSLGYGSKQKVSSGLNPRFDDLVEKLHKIEQDYLEEVVFLYSQKKVSETFARARLSDSERMIPGEPYLIVVNGILNAGEVFNSGYFSPEGRMQLMRYATPEGESVFPRDLVDERAKLVRSRKNYLLSRLKKKSGIKDKESIDLKSKINDLIYEESVLEKAK